MDVHRVGVLKTWVSVAEKMGGIDTIALEGHSSVAYVFSGNLTPTHPLVALITLNRTRLSWKFDTPHPPCVTKYLNDHLLYLDYVLQNLSFIITANIIITYMQFVSSGVVLLPFTTGGTIGTGRLSTHTT